MTTYCWKTVLHGFSHISKYIVSRGINNICSGLSFSGCLLLRTALENSIFLQRREQVCLLSGKIKMFPSITEFWAGLLVFHYKRQGFPKLGIPQLWYKPNEGAALSGPLCITPMGLGGQGSWHELEAHQFAVAWITESFVSDPGASSLLLGLPC